MGTLRGDNGGERPPEGGGLPGFPPEWGAIVIPDDAAALDHEAELVRKELRRHMRRNRWRRRFGLPPARHQSPDDDAPALGLPLLIMSIAIIATLTSLFAIAWPSRAGQSIPLARTTTPVATTASMIAVPDLNLHAANGAVLRLRDMLPAVVLLVDGCACADLISSTASAVNPRVTVLAVGHTPPKLPKALPANRLVRSAGDASDTLRADYGGSPRSPGVTALLVRETGEVVYAIPDVKSVDNLSAYLSQLV
jgi:hypothetical protein